MAWFSKKQALRIARTEEERERPSRMRGLWAKCEQCSEIIYREEIEKNLNVCPHCGHHMPWPSRARLLATLDPDSFEEFDKNLEPQDPLGFVDSKKYRERLKATRKSLGENDAFVSGVGRLDGRRISVGCFLFEFMGGSMGSVVGEKVARVFERAVELECPAVIFSASGGARMQEGIYSLMQMAKTSAALQRLSEARLPYLSVLTDPTTGGVTASYAMLGDLNIAEPKALIGFAGPRVIEQTIRQTLPDGFQRAEFLVEHGMVDVITPRAEMKPAIARFLRFLRGQ